jgi:preprotein translocase subunit YajC
VPALIVIVALLALMWLLLIRPQRKRQQAQQELVGSVQIGDEIVTAGGIYGTISAVRESEIDLEIAPGTNVRIARRAIAGVISDEEEEEPEEDEELEDEEPEEEEEVVEEPKAEKLKETTVKQS